MKLNKEKGFTLIELLVVIAIIGVLSTLAVVSLNNARSKSRDSKRVADVKQIQNALELYYNDINGYPSAPAAVTLGSDNNYAVLGSTGGFTPSTTVHTTKYMQQVPSAPTPAETGCTGANQNDYRYTSTASTSYSITYCLGAQTGGVPAGVNTACQAGLTGC